MHIQQKHSYGPTLEKRPVLLPFYFLKKATSPSVYDGKADRAT